MYFYIGDLAKDETDETKRAVIISSKLMKNRSKDNDCDVVMNLKNGDDWDENYKQLVLFLRQIYNFNNDEIEWNDYGSHPFKIYQIAPNNLDKILKEARSGNVHKFNTFIEEYELQVEILGGVSLKNFFESNEDCNECGMYVTYKKYLELTYNNTNGYNVCHWVPSTYCNIQNVEEINWDDEFAAMKEFVCKYFHLKDDDKLKFEHFDDETDVDDGETCQTAWEDLLDDDDIMFCRITVSGEVGGLIYMCFVSLG